jgi:hypothetical protein
MMMSRRKKASEMTLAEYMSAAAGLATATEQTPTTWAAEWDGEESEKANWWQRQWMAIEAGSAEAI